VLHRIRRACRRLLLDFSGFVSAYPVLDMLWIFGNIAGREYLSA